MFKVSLLFFSLILHSKFLKLKGSISIFISLNLPSDFNSLFFSKVGVEVTPKKFMSKFLTIFKKLITC